MEYAQLAVLLDEMYSALRSDLAGREKVEELIISVRLVDNVHEAGTGKLQDLLDLRRDLDQKPESDMGTPLDERLQSIVESVSHRIEDEFIGFSQRSAKIIHGLDFITDDDLALEAAWNATQRYYRLGDAIDRGAPEVQSLMEACDSDREAFKVRARIELDRTRRGKTSKPENLAESRPPEPSLASDSTNLAFHLAFIQVWIGALIAFYLIGVTSFHSNLMFWAVVSVVFGLLMAELLFFGYSHARNDMPLNKLTGAILRHLWPSTIFTSLIVVALFVVALIWRL